MNTIFYFVLILAMLAPNLNRALPFLSGGKERGAANVNEASENDNKLLQQSVDMLQRWLSLQTSKILSKISEIDYNLNKKIFDGQQSSQYKFDVVTHSITTMQHHWNEVQQMQQDLKDQKKEMSVSSEGIRNLHSLVKTIEGKLEMNNKTFEDHIDSIDGKFNKLQEKINQYHILGEDVKLFKDKTLSDLNILIDKVSQQEMVIGKLMDNAAGSNQKTNEMQQNTQQGMELLRKSILALKNDYEQQKTLAQRQTIDMKEQLNNELNLQKKKMAHQITSMHLSLTSALEMMNSTLNENYDVSKQNVDGVKKSVDTIAKEMTAMKNMDQLMQGNREQILRELYLQKQEIKKQAGVIKAVKEDIDVLVSFPGFKTGKPMKPNYIPKM